MLRAPRRRTGKSVVFVVGALACATLVANIALASWLRRNVWFGLDHIARADSASLYGAPSTNAVREWDDLSSASAVTLRDETRALLADGGRSERDVIALRHWVRSQARAAGLDIDAMALTDPVEVLHAMRAGKSAACGPFAVLYLGVLRAHGIPARMVLFTRNLVGVPDAHSTVEVYVDGRWRLHDPTFDAHWQRAGAALDARALKAYMLTRNADGGVGIVRGSAAIEPSLETYYVDPVALFQNVVFMRPLTQAERVALRWPPLRVLRRNLVALTDARWRPDDASVVVHNLLVVTVALVMPGVVIALLIVMAWMWPARAQPLVVVVDEEFMLPPSRVGRGVLRGVDRVWNSGIR